MSRFLSEKINRLKPYVPGEQPKEREYIKLNTNESPFPPSKKAIELASVEANKLYLYPDPDVKDLTKAVADSLGVTPNNVIMTNGSDEALNFTFMAYCDGDRPAIFPDITYGFYKVFAQVNGVIYNEVPLNDDFTVNIEELIKQRGTIFIANPNAPTGIYLELSDIERILCSDKDRIVVVDEAYIDFGGQSAVKLIDKYDNLIVTQTFSKSRSMAGARLGFAVASEGIISDLNRIKYSTNPYNVNRMTAGAGLGAICDVKYFNENCTKIIANREYVTKELKDLGFALTPSLTNFVFAKSDKIGGKELYLALKDKGVLVRHFDSERINAYIRVTIGNKEQMQKFINYVKQILEKI